MAQATFNIDEFRTNILNDSLARTNRFEVIINPPVGLRSSFGRKVSMLVESTNFPLINIASKSFKIFGPSYQRPYTAEFGGEGLQMTFHVDRDMRVKRFFDNWMGLIIDPEDFTTAYQSEYISTIDIHQLDEANNIKYAVQLLEAFPRNMNLMDLNNASSNQTHRLNILFSYRYWVPLPRAENVEQGSVTVTPIREPRMIVTPQIPFKEWVSQEITPWSTDPEWT